MEVFVYLIIGTFVLILFATVCLTLVSWWRDQESRRYLNEHLLRPDKLGNQPTYIDPARGLVIQPSPGNSPVPVNIIMYNGIQKEVKKFADERPLIINYGSQIRDGEVSIPELAEPTEPTIELSSSSELPELPEPEWFNPNWTIQMAQEKRAGKSAYSAIPVITNVPKGGSKKFRYLLETWERL